MRVLFVRENVSLCNIFEILAPLSLLMTGRTTENPPANNYSPMSFATLGTCYLIEQRAVMYKVVSVSLNTFINTAIIRVLVFMTS